LTLVILIPMIACMPTVHAAISTMNDNNRDIFCTFYFDSYAMFFDKSMIFLISLDTLAMIVVYSYIINTIRSQSSQHDQLRNNSHKATMTSLWIILTFLVCYWPRFLCSFVSMSWYLRSVVVNLPYVNCLMDPIIYALRLKKVQDGFHALSDYVCRCRRTAHDIGIALVNRE
jgi:hypothetical protein